MGTHLKDVVLKALPTMLALFVLFSAGRTEHCSSVQQIWLPLHFLVFPPSPCLVGVAVGLSLPADVLQLLWLRLSTLALAEIHASELAL